MISATDSAPNRDRITPTGTFRARDVVTYTPDGNMRDCREGQAIAVAASARTRLRNQEVVLVDTFWSGGPEVHVLTPTEIASAEWLFNISDFDELDPNSRTSHGEWERFHPSDRARITSQHGLCQRLFIRKGASPDRATQVANAEGKVREAESKVRSAQGALEIALLELQLTRDAAAR